MLSAPARTGTREATRRRQILDAALTVFLENGYVGTSTDQLASASSASKQTLYKYFTDKEGLFAAMIVELGDSIDDPFADASRSADVDAETAVRAIAEQFTRSIMSPRVQQIRRLVIAEAARFPDLGRLYWERGFERVIASVARHLEVLDGRGLLAVPDPLIAAQHLAGLLLWIPSNRVMFHGRVDAVTPEELTGFADAGARAFLAAYRPGA